MNNKNIICASGLLIAAACMHPAEAAAKRQQCTTVSVRDTQFVMLGKSSIIPLQSPVSRVIVDGPPAAGMGNPPAAHAPVPAPAAPAAATNENGVADMDVLLLSPTDLFFRGRRAGTMNVILQDVKGACFVQDIIVTIDPSTLQAKLKELMPEENGIQVKSAENAIILTGSVVDTAKLDEAMRVATAYGDGKRVVNLLRVSAPQQVMLEVKIAEVSKNLLDRFDIDLTRMFTSADGLTSKVISGIFGGNPALFGRFHPSTSGGIAGNAAGAASGSNAAASSSMSTSGSGTTLLGIDAQKKDGLVRVLAEPNIMAISGQAASFLSGGKIFIPIAQTQEGLGTRITLEEKEFGVGLKFTPTVLNGTRINLKLVSEVSELSQTGSPFTTLNGVTSVLPSISTRRIDTTVQLNDGQSFAIAGLIKNNITETLKRFPGLGEIPILGMLFRSTEFQNDKTELMFIVTPRLVKPAGAGTVLPTDNHVAPQQPNVLFMGKAEGRGESIQPGEGAKK